MSVFRHNILREVVQPLVYVHQVPLVCSFCFGVVEFVSSPLLPLHQFQRQLAILMMFNTYDVEEGEETKQTQQHQSKRNRREVPDAHKLMVAPPHAKCYVGKPGYKWDLTASQKYQQLACSTGCGTKT